MPLVYQQTLTNNTLFGVWEINETIEELESLLILDKDEKKLLNGFKNKARKEQWLSYRVLIKKLLNYNDFITIRYDQFGKPHMINPEYYLSVSHTNNFSAIILNKNQRVGIDIEAIHPKIFKVIDRFTHSSEKNHSNYGENLEKAIVYWGVKEAIYKIFGRINLYFNEDIIIDDFEYKEQGIVYANVNHEGNIKRFKLNYQKYDKNMIVYITDNEMIVY